MPDQNEDGRWVVTQEDLDRVAVRGGEYDGDALCPWVEFTPEGYSSPFRFSFGGSCGLQERAGVSLSIYREGRRMGGAMTHDQARRLFWFLWEHYDLLADELPAVGTALLPYDEWAAVVSRDAENYRRLRAGGPGRPPPPPRPPAATTLRPRWSARLGAAAWWWVRLVWWAVVLTACTRLLLGRWTPWP